MIVIIFILLLFLFITGGTPTEQILYTNGYFIDDLKYKLYEVGESKNPINLISDKPGKFNIPFKRIVNGRYFYSKQSIKPPNIDWNRFNRFPVFNSSDDHRSYKSSRIVALAFQRFANENAYKFEGLYCTTNNITRCSLNGHYFNILHFNNHYYIMSSLYGKYQYRINKITTNINSFLKRLKSNFNEIFDISPMRQTPLYIYPYTRPTDFFQLDKTLGEIEDFYIKKLNENNIDVNILDKFKEMSGDEIIKEHVKESELGKLYGRISRIYSDLRARPISCKKTSKFIPFYDKLPGFHKKKLEIGDFHNIIIKIFENPEKYGFALYKGNDRWSLCIADRLMQNSDCKKYCSFTIRDLLEFSKNAYPELNIRFADIVSQMEISDEYTVQITLYVKRGIHSHIDNIKSIHPLHVLNVGTLINYDMYNIFDLRCKPIRVFVESGEYVTMVGDARIKWAHSIPDFTCFIRNRFAVVFRRKHIKTDLSDYKPLAGEHLERPQLSNFSIYANNGENLKFPLTRCLKLGKIQNADGIEELQELPPGAILKNQHFIGLADGIPAQKAQGGSYFKCTVGYLLDIKIDRTYRVFSHNSIIHIKKDCEWSSPKNQCVSGILSIYTL